MHVRLGTRTNRATRPLTARRNGVDHLWRIETAEGGQPSHAASQSWVAPAGGGDGDHGCFRTSAVDHASYLVPDHATLNLSGLPTKFVGAGLRAALVKHPPRWGPIVLR